MTQPTETVYALSAHYDQITRRRRDFKRTDFTRDDQVFPTFEAAHQAMIDRARLLVMQANEAQARALRRLEKTRNYRLLQCPDKTRKLQP